MSITEETSTTVRALEGANADLRQRLHDSDTDRGRLLRVCVDLTDQVHNTTRQWVERGEQVEDLTAQVAARDATIADLRRQVENHERAALANAAVQDAAAARRRPLSGFERLLSGLAAVCASAGVAGWTAGCLPAFLGGLIVACALTAATAVSYTSPTAFDLDPDASKWTVRRG